MDDGDAREILERLSVANDAPVGGRPLSMSRRRFISLLGGGVAGAAVAPWLSQMAAFAAPPVGAHQGILVIVQMGGGNDGLNTFVPLADPAYAARRRRIGYAARDLLAVTPQWGLNPKLPRLAERWAKGQVAAIGGVGPPNPNLSHFESMATWMSGWGGAATSRATGWIGRWLDTLPNAANEPLYAVTVGSQVPLHLQGASTRASGMPEQIQGAFGIDRSDPADARMFDTISAFADEPTGLGSLADYFAWSERQTMALAQKIRPAYDGWQPTYDIGRQLMLCARLINANLGIRVFNVSIGSFDTHTNQRGAHERLLDELDRGLNVFFRNVNAKWADRVAVLTFSEFGRRVEDNDGAGTDHGTASTMFLIGNKVNGGIRTLPSSLSDLDPYGNLKVKIDFRRVYATVLGDWLKANPTKILGKSYPKLSLFRSGP